MPPIFPALVSVIIGILIGHFFQFTLVTWIVFLGLSIILSVMSRGKIWPIFAAFVCLAGLRYSAVRDERSFDPLKSFNQQQVILRLHPVEEAHGVGEEERFVANADKLYVDHRVEPIRANVIVYRIKNKVDLSPFSERVGNIGENMIALGRVGELPKKLGFYKRQSCFHIFTITRIFRIETNHNVLQKTRIAIVNSIQNFLNQSLTAPYNNLATAVLFGKHQALQANLLNDFRVTGTYHVLVASGLKVALVAGGVWLLTWFAPFYFRVIFSGVAILGYAWLCGFDPPVLRASLMVILAFGGFLLGRGSDSYGAFFLTALLLLLFNPLLLFDPGFQLTFLSVLGILLFFEKIAKRFSFLPGWIADSIAVTLSAQILIIVPLAFYFHSVSFVSPIANLLVVPLTAVSMFLSANSFALHFVWEPLSFTLSYWHQAALSLMLWIVEVCSRIPWAFRWVSEPTLLTSVLVYGVFLGFLISRAKIRYSVVAVCAALLAGSWIWRIVIPSDPKISFLDVGQGDSTLISLDGKNFLVDGGGSLGETSSDGFSVGDRVLVPEVEKEGINSLDGILLTDSTLDHVGGLIAVVKHFPVKQIWLSRSSSDSYVYKTFLREAVKRKISLVFIQGNEKIRLTREGSLNLFCLNNNSIVSQLVINNVRILLSGDIENDLWASQILKVPHHGSGTSSTVDFLKAISPQVAVVSVGAKNLYHQPSPDTMRGLHRMILNVFRTDQDGSVQFIVHSSDANPWLERVGMKESTSFF